MTCFLPLPSSHSLTDIVLCCQDEPMLAGISAANITAVADFIRARIGPKPKLYWNDGCRPFYDGHTEPCVHDPGKNPASCWTNDSKVPASVDWVSCDTYEDPTVSKSPWPWDPSTSIPEADAVKIIAHRFIVPKLHDHQQVLLVPGTFACSNLTYFALDGQAKNVVDKMEGYFKWAKAEKRIGGFVGW